MPHPTKKHRLIALKLAAFLLAASPALAQPAPTGVQSPTRWASMYAGTDCAAKILTTSLSFSNQRGEVLVDTTCGALTSSVTTPITTVVHFEPGLYSWGATEQFNVMECSGNNLTQVSQVQTTTLAPVSSIAYFDEITAQGGSITGGCYFLGTNGPNHVTNGIIINGTGTSAGANASLRDLTVTLCSNDGILIQSSTTTANNAYSPVLINISSYSNTLHGIEINATSDVQMVQVFPDANGGDGIHCTVSCNGLQVIGGDIGLNANYGINITSQVSGAAGGGGFGSGDVLISAVKFSEGNKNDINMGCWDAANSVYSIPSTTITGNSFWFSPTRTDATYSAILLTDCTGIAVIGNTFFSFASHRLTYAVQEANTAGHSATNQISPSLNTLSGPFSAGFVLDLAPSSYIRNYFAATNEGAGTSVTMNINAMAGGFLYGNPGAGNATYTTDTAAAICSNFSQATAPAVNQQASLIVANQSGTNNIVVAAGSNVTLFGTGNFTVLPGKIGNFIIAPGNCNAASQTAIIYAQQ